MHTQVTKFGCDGAVVGCTFDHRVCDAYSFNMFLVAWAAAARGSPAPPAPSFRRSFLAPRNPAPPCTGTLADRLFVPVSPRAGTAGHHRLQPHLPRGRRRRRGAAGGGGARAHEAGGVHGAPVAAARPGGVAPRARVVLHGRGRGRARATAPCGATSATC